LGAEAVDVEGVEGRLIALTCEVSGELVGLEAVVVLGEVVLGEGLVV